MGVFICFPCFRRFRNQRNTWVLFTFGSRSAVAANEQENSWTSTETNRRKQIGTCNFSGFEIHYITNAGSYLQKQLFAYKNALPHTQKCSMLKVTRFFVNQTFIALGSEGDIKLFRAVPLQAVIEFGTGWRSITKHAVTQQSCPRCGCCSLGFNQRGSQIFCYSKALPTRMKNVLNADKDTRYRHTKYFFLNRLWLSLFH